MRKQRTKRCCFETLCTEVQLGVWEWETSGTQWQYSPLPGLNLVRKLPNGDVQPIVWCKSLDAAVCWTCGYILGFQNGLKSKELAERVLADQSQL